MNRRTFISAAALAGVAKAILPRSFAKASPSSAPEPRPMVLATWNFGESVTSTAYQVLAKGGSSLDAVEQGVRIPEADPKVESVGYGGLPDRDGKVTLDASIMEGTGRCGSVLFLEHIMHPVSVARLVMEQTPHVILAGEGALQFALDHGFKKENLLTPESEEKWKEWLKTNKYTPHTVEEASHDTIGMLAMDAQGKMAGACTTSGLAWKIRGRVGDSPIIGAGLFVDDGVGAATSTGIGEAAIKVAGSFLIVELMRAGASPREACRKAIERIAHKYPEYRDIDNFTVGFIALSKAGEIGAVSYKKGLQYSLNTDGTNRVFDAEYIV